MKFYPLEVPIDVDKMLVFSSVKAKDVTGKHELSVVKSLNKN